MFERYTEKARHLLRAETTFKVTAYQRVTVQGSRVWQGIVVCDERTNCTEADANKFLDSIKIR